VLSRDVRDERQRKDAGPRSRKGAVWFWSGFGGGRFPRWAADLRVRGCGSGFSLTQGLPGELKSPGRFHLRTIDFLQTASRVDVQRITELVPFLMNGKYFSPGTDEYADVPYCPSFDLHMTLQELRVVSAINDPLLPLKWKRDPSFVFELQYFGRSLHYVDREGSGAGPPIQALTSLGIELAQLAREVTPPAANWPYFKAFANKLAAHGHVTEVMKDEQTA
jgi:hypothetical protein